MQMQDPHPQCEVSGSAPLLERLRHAVAPLGLGEWGEPDQPTGNEYEPGQGIAAHVETHSAFGDALCGICPF